jgi:ABC-type sugar transport system ATPase subunit
MFDLLSQRSDGKLKLELAHAANHQAFQDELRTLVRGSGARTADIETIAHKMTPHEFVELTRSRDISGLATKAGITNNSSQVIIDKLWSGETIQPLLELEHSYYPEDVPSIQFRKDDGTYAPLTELSVGQKCTALLIIALSEGARPVIIDQPEDSLDITTVWEDVSRKLRQSKEKRQFIVTTHNPSVAVAADSDMFIVVKSNAQQANVKCLGAIEHPDVKKAVIQHLEGGKEPYQLRRHKYNM